MNNLKMELQNIMMSTSWNIVKEQTSWTARLHVFAETQGKVLSVKEHLDWKLWDWGRR